MERELPLYLIAKETGQDIDIVREWSWQKIQAWSEALKLLNRHRSVSLPQTRHGTVYQKRIRKIGNKVIFENLF